MTDASTRTVQLATDFIGKGDPLGWFEELYATANGDPTTVPWARLTPHPLFVEWLNQHSLVGKTAIVIGCGLGDDAEELAKRGMEVTAFDISETAIAWCKKRFPDSSVNYQVADLFQLALGKFDFVLESYTIQAMPPELRAQAIPKIAELVAESGQLLVICLGREPEQPLATVPFPLTKIELSGFTQAGLHEVKFEDLNEPETVRRWRVQYQG
ncbi:putative thiopurine S-methyltransferase [Leptolyngbya boryana NIES-2135]|jgi:SAM-dependent methyltransferase|uniref:Putative thiopurine S-methyltransferase n=1 Tax=Leptolyngbya boryana NIES-2135 TaxID=1973484 RepID=A0A1Z4JHH5_LEPBY|nr:MULTISPECIES: class I SAM-dependent methyltransferase [Leptolyngbya]BAY56180.1 putative thiopurine S-methyltransferase [Leptolyngbya boryana NIES-2135]MBD2366287.1 class I SAM-dependent methyltransferase [Leptolyngbya sp. FACHB-161]MBD2372467.1 class I SAM-dependent methyltransferase [Leptolyngbya sp. FACHB-238]MBD2396890.1 class I SAM-dependent methyltransferase [Leptolyngbya sp. FACHB-239]MBD2403413.1 class I SAM-dependent methyltransferase [Leptolyngbya sp. FACHB-402]